MVFMGSTFYDGTITRAVRVSTWAYELVTFERGHVAKDTAEG